MVLGRATVVALASIGIASILLLSAFAGATLTVRPVNLHAAATVSTIGGGRNPVSVHVGHPASPEAAAGDLRPAFLNVTPFNCTPLNLTGISNPGVPELGINFSVATTPWNSTGPAPLNFSWNISIGGGGLPPYHPWVYLDTGSQALSSLNDSGNLTLTEAGTWGVEVGVEDASCTQFSETTFNVFAWNAALGPNPIAVSASPLIAPAPAVIHYALTAPTVPAGWSLFWPGTGFYPYAAAENHTYYLPGLYQQSICLVEPDGTTYTCGASDTVNVTGPSPIQTAVTVGNGSFPVNVTFWVNITNSSAFPANTTMDLSAWTGTQELSSSTNGTRLNLTESVGCGYPWTKWAVPTGNCTYIGVLTMWGPVGSPDDGALVVDGLAADLNANGSPINWWPSVSYSYGPTNGTAPLNVSVNISAKNGLAPYSLAWVALGDSGNGSGSVLYNASYATYAGWNGSLMHLTIPLAQVGYYWVSVQVVASNWGFVQFGLPLVVVGNATIPVFSPLTVSAGDAGANGGVAGNLGSGGTVTFAASVSGGEAPYTVQWDFGDGQYGSSALGGSVSHRYTTAGNFTPSVTITDARGTTVTESLPSITVAGTGTGGSPAGGHPTNNHGGGPPPAQQFGPGPAAPAAPWATGALLVLAVAFIIGGLLLLRRELGREGDALVAGLEPSDSGAPSSGEP